MRNFLTPFFKLRDVYGSLFELCLALQKVAVARAQAAEQQVLILQRKIEALQEENITLKQQVSKLTADLVRFVRLIRC